MFFIITKSDGTLKYSSKRLLKQYNNLNYLKLITLIILISLEEMHCNIIQPYTIINQAGI